MTLQFENDQIERIYESEGKIQLIYDYTTMQGGKYQFCFEDKLGLYNEIYFEYLIGIEANDMHEIAQKSDLALIQETLNNIQAKLQFMKQQLIIFSQVKLENIFSLESLYYYIVKSDFIGFGIIFILIIMEVYILKRKILRKKIQ
ncbi:unnamed protein product [Paramecium pentaurelia]|uniref:GOLD domain-containing protein n=1 Tax=Paramecium pentaurelia TaxID=43138 RepID=A0A8S1U0E0_9CILI|nr:unnamed protein product [Paramecium pentaurelia]